MSTKFTHSTYQSLLLPYLCKKMEEAWVDQAERRMSIAFASVTALVCPQEATAVSPCKLWTLEWFWVWLASTCSGLSHRGTVFKQTLRLKQLQRRRQLQHSLIHKRIRPLRIAPAENLPSVSLLIGVFSRLLYQRPSAPARPIR